MSLSMHVEKEMEGFKLKIDLETEKGIMGLLGYSGSGKTMTLKMIAGMVTPDKGEIVLNGRTLFDSNQRINLRPQQRNVGLMFQSYALFNTMSVYENIAIGMKQAKQEKADEINKWLKLLELENLKDRKPKMLSGGQKQRVALARILAQKPEILLLDEPFSALDNHLKFKLEQDFKRALELFNGTVLYVSHNRQEIYRYCKETAIVSNGRIVEVKQTSDLFENCESLAGAKLTGCRNITFCEWRSSQEIVIPAWEVRLAGPFKKKNFTHIGLRDSAFKITNQLEDETVIKARKGQIDKLADKVKLELWTLQGERMILTCSLNEYEGIRDLLDNPIIGIKIQPDKLLFLKE